MSGRSINTKLAYISCKCIYALRFVHFTNLCRGPEFSEGNAFVEVALVACAACDSCVIPLSRDVQTTQFAVSYSCRPMANRWSVVNELSQLILLSAIASVDHCNGTWTELVSCLGITENM